MLDNVFPLIASWVGECAEISAYIALLSLAVNMFLRAVKGKEVFF